MKKESGLLILFCVSLPIALMLLSYNIVLFSTSLTQSQKQAFHFLQSDKPLSLNFTASEQSHLADVKQVMMAANYIFFGSLLMCLLIVAYYVNKKMPIEKLLQSAGATTIAVLLIILLFFLVNFNLLFTLFHHLFFPQGNWIFAADSLLIRTFPEEFFRGISLKIFILTLLFAVVVTALSWKKR